MKCDKTTYHSFAEAEKALSGFSKSRHFEKMNRRFATKKPKRAYHCPHCNLYHLTSRKKKNR